MLLNKEGALQSTALHVSSHQTAVTDNIHAFIIIHECSTEPFFFVSTNVREMAAFSRAERVFVQEQESPLLP